jgi:hypothetical protein
MAVDPEHAAARQTFGDVEYFLLGCSSMKEPARVKGAGTVPGCLNARSRAGPTPKKKPAC